MGKRHPVSGHHVRFPKIGRAETPGRALGTWREQGLRPASSTLCICNQEEMPPCGKAAGDKASAYAPVIWVHRQGDTKSPTTSRRVCHPGALCGPSVLSVPAKCFPVPRGSFQQPGAWGPRDPGHAERGRALEPLPRDQRHPCRRLKVLIPKWGSHCPGWSKRPRESTGHARYGEKEGSNGDC